MGPLKKDTTGDPQAIWKAESKITHTFQECKRALQNYYRNNRETSCLWKKGISEENRIVKRQHTLCGMKNVLPDYSEGEDEKSMESHMSRIQKIQQLLKEKQDKFQINKLVEITFFHPRILLVTEFVTV